MVECKSPTSIILSKLIWLIVFVILLIIANLLVLSIPNQTYKDVLGFLNANLIFFVFLLFIDLINEIFWNFRFPFILLAPITRTILAVFIVNLLYRIWNFVTTSMDLKISVPILIIYALVGITVLILSYVKIITVIARDKKESRKIKKIKDLINKKDEIQWKDINSQLNSVGKNLERTAKEVLYNLADALNKHLEVNKDKK